MVAAQKLHRELRNSAPVRSRTRAQRRTQLGRLGRISTTSSTPKYVNPTSILCAGKIGPYHVPAVSASPSGPGARTTPSRVCTATVVKRRAASAPSMTSPAHAWTAVHARCCTGFWPRFSCAWRVPHGVLPESWGAMSAPLTAGVGGCAMPPSPMRADGSEQGRSKPMSSITPLAPRDRPRRAGRHQWAVRHGGGASNASPGGAMTTTSGRRSSSGGVARAGWCSRRHGPGRARRCRRRPLWPGQPAVSAPRTRPAAPA